MKRHVFFLMGFCLILLSGACKKHRIERHYTGSFSFTNHFTSWDINGNSTDTTMIGHGSVSIYENASLESNSAHPVFLKVEYSSGSYYIVEVNKDGTFVTQTYLHGQLSGGFSDDDHLQFSHTDGGLGGSYTLDAIGVRE